MKEKKWGVVPKSKYGRVIFSNNDLMPHERETVYCLSSFGFDVETVIPSNLPGSNNPDLLMFGTFWEMKGPTTSNEGTIQTKFRKAVKQTNGSGKAVFDLRSAKPKERGEIEQLIMKLFKKTPGMRRVIIIREDDDCVDFMK